VSGERAAESRADHRADAQQAVEPLGLLRVEHVGRDQPALRDQRDAEQADPDVEQIVHPAEVVLQQPPDREQRADEESGVGGDRAPQAGLDRDLGVQVGDQPAGGRDQGVQVGQAVDIEIVQKHRPRNRFQDVIREQNRQQVQGHEEGAGDLPGTNVEGPAPEAGDAAQQGKGS
jgi:hypothetical protein